MKTEKPKKAELTLIPKELNAEISKTKIEHSKAEQHALAFAPSMKDYILNAEIIKGLNKLSPTEIDAKKAREARLKLVKVRTGAEEIKDLRKEGIKAEGDLIQSLFNVVKNSCLLTENEYLEIEKHQERQEAKRKAELAISRKELLVEFGTDTTYLPLETMTDDQFDRLLANEALLFTARKEASEKVELARIEAERIAEENRLAAIEKERLDRIAQEEENERLRKENEAKEALLAKEREEAAKEQKRLSDLAKSQKEEAEKEAVRVQDIAKQAAEKLAKENEAKLAEQKRLSEIEAKKQAEELAKQKQAAEKLAKELKEKKDAEEFAIAKKAAEEKSAQLAPDKDKINALYLAIKNVELPIMSTTEADQLVNKIAEKIRDVLMFIKVEAKNLQ